MTYGVKLHVWGDYGCFTRPEMKAERVSYDVMTPSAARGILEAIHWKPAICWTIDRIHVLEPIRFQSIRRNELVSKIPIAGQTGIKSAMNKNDLSKLGQSIEDNRVQRATMALYKPAYIIEAHFDLTEKAQDDDTADKHISMFNRRAAKGQCFHHPCLGCREFAADFELIEDGFPTSNLPEENRNRDLGWMLYDIDYQSDNQPVFFRARLEDGVLNLTKVRPEAFAI